MLEHGYKGNCVRFKATHAPPSHYKLSMCLAQIYDTREGTCWDTKSHTGQSKPWGSQYTPGMQIHSFIIGFELSSSTHRCDIYLDRKE